MEAGREHQEKIRQPNEKSSKKVGKVALSTFIDEETRLRLHQQLDEAIDNFGLVSKATFTIGEHTGFIKNSDNEIEYTKPLQNESMRISVEFNHEPQWPPVTKIEARKLSQKERKVRPDGGNRAVILPDLQLPFVDEKALSIAKQIIQEVKPDQIIFVGDTLDLSAWGRFIKRPEYAQATKESFRMFYELLHELRHQNRSADIVVIEGNHEARMDKDLLMNAQAAYGLKPADKPDGWPVMSVPNLCGFESLDVQYVPGYPANRYWLNERLQIIHGDLARPSGKTARAVINNERVSTIFGHTHRIESASQTSQDYKGGKQHFTFNIGTLSNLDGSVPGVRSNSSPESGNHNLYNWQHGLMVVDYLKGDAPFQAQQIYINTFDGYTTRFNGKTFLP